MTTTAWNQLTKYIEAGDNMKITTLALLITVSIMNFHVEHGNIRASLWDGKTSRSGLIVKGSPSFAWFKEHVSRRTSQKFGEADAETVNMEFANDTITSIK